MIFTEPVSAGTVTRKSSPCVGLILTNNATRATGDFLIDYYPGVSGLFVATGDSGHGFKVFPIIGEKILDAIQGKLDYSLLELWRFREKAASTFHGVDDGTRGGKRGMILENEY